MLYYLCLTIASTLTSGLRVFEKVMRNIKLSHVYIGSLPYAARRLSVSLGAKRANPASRLFCLPKSHPALPYSMLCKLIRLPYELSLIVLLIVLYARRHIDNGLRPSSIFRRFSHSFRDRDSFR